MSTQIFQTSGLSKSFQLGAKTLTALTDVTVDIPQGTCLALRGPSGSGKTTLLNLLGLIEKPSAGSLKLLGQTVSTLGEAELTRIRRRSIGFIFQNFNLMPMLTALENVEYALLIERAASRAEIRKRAMNALDRLGIAACADQKPAQLSGGQRQRVAIARAVVKQPAVILGDEPTANLDSVNSREVMQVLRGLNREFGTTVIVATHDAETASYLGQELRLMDGRVVGTFALAPRADDRVVAGATAIPAAAPIPGATAIPAAAPIPGAGATPPIPAAPRARDVSREAGL